MAAVWRQESRKAQDPNLQMHLEPGIQRGILLQRTLGEDQRMLLGRDGDGFRQHWTQRIDRSNSARRYLSKVQKFRLAFDIFQLLSTRNKKQRMEKIIYRATNKIFER